ncbi:MAG: MFS transporter [Patescibacteria group bacterium]
MKLLFAIRVVRELANKFALFFLPVFLFQLGQEIRFLSTEFGLTPFQGGVVLLAGFFILARLLIFFLLIPSGKFMKKYGFSASFMLSFLTYAIELIALRFATQNPNWLWLAIPADAMSTALMWGGFNTLLSKGARRSRMGTDLGFMQVLLNLTWLVAPALSGFVIFIFGYETLFSIGVAMVAVGSFLSYFIDFAQEKDNISLKEFKFWLNDWRFWKLGISLVGKAFYDNSVYIWPLYVFLLLGNTEKVGIVYSLSFLVSMILSLFVGLRLDSEIKKQPFFVSGGILSFLWYIRSQILGFWSIALTDAIDKITGNFHWLFFDRVLMNRGKGREAFSYFTYREMIVSFATVIFWLLFVVIFLFSSMEWNGLFLVAAIGTLLSLLISKKHED